MTNYAQYMMHLPTCTIMQDWSEAEDALAHTPDGPDKDFAYGEMCTIRNTCSCGYLKAIKELEDWVDPLFLDRDLFDSFSEGESMKIVITRIQTVHRPFELEFKFVAVKGGADDWAIYCHLPIHHSDFIKTNGDKVQGKALIQSLCPCTPEILARYRH